MKTIFGAALLAIGLVMPTAVQAGCTLGVKSCVGGWWQVCQTCGSETCMIATATKCYRPNVPNEDKLTYTPVPKALFAQLSIAGTDGKKGQ